MNQQPSQKPGEPRSTTGQQSTNQNTSRPDDSAPRATPDGAEADPAMQGEGNRTAARRYNEETTDFARSGRVDQAARDARPEGTEQARDMERAEAEGKSHSRGEDPLLRKGAGGGRGEKG
jgi:hypothetical protein